MLRWKDSDSFAQFLPLLEESLNYSPPHALVEPIFGYQSLLLVFEKPVAESSVRDWIESLSRPRQRKDPATTKAIQSVEVYYDGPDLKRLAQEKSCSIEELIHRHCKPIYTVHCIGFSPGFPYLGPLDPFLWTPRRENPRKRIRPGAVAIGGQHTGIYSIASPGGWHWIGNTTLTLFNSAAAKQPSPEPEQCFAFKPGDRVRLVPVSL